MTLDPDTFRAVLGRFASGITVLTACGDDGRDHGMTVSSLCSVSLEPPLVLACVAHDAWMHELVLRAEYFAVSILASHQEALSRRFSGVDAGGRRLPGMDSSRFEGVGFTRGQHGPALLDDALAHLECRTWARYPGGDHTILVGEVETGAVRGERPLLYYRGGYAQLER